MIILKIDNVNKKYKNGVIALKNVNFETEKGEFISIIGPSGAGKTSLIRMLNGSLTPDSGNIIYDIEGRKVINELKTKEKRMLQRHIATIYQDFCLVEQLSCLHNVLNAELYKMPLWKVLSGRFSVEQKKRAKKALDMVGLSDKYDKKASSLSGGQKQRVAIARAIMQEPEVLLADEPVASLDPYTSVQILDIMSELKNKYNITIIMNSHNVDAALKYSDRIIGINDGKVVIDKKKTELKKEDLNIVYKSEVRLNNKE